MASPVRFSKQIEFVTGASPCISTFVDAGCASGCFALRASFTSHEFQHSPFAMLGDEGDGSMNLPFADEGRKCAIQLMNSHTSLLVYLGQSGLNGVSFF